MAEVGFDSLEWLLKRLSAPAELTHKLAKKLWALWLGLGGVALAGHSGQAQARSVVYCVVGPCKTESSQKPVHPVLGDALTDWKKRATYGKADDWT